MADVFSQIYIQIVFAVKYRKSLIMKEWEDDLYKYTTGIIQNRGNKLLAIGGMPDHIHIFIGLKPAENLSDLVRQIKISTNAYISENHLSNFKFEWQNGYGAFSYTRSHRERVCKYILNQKTHHAKQSFKAEYNELLKKSEIEIGKKQMFEFIL